MTIEPAKEEHIVKGSCKIVFKNKEEKRKFHELLDIPYIEEFSVTTTDGFTSESFIIENEVLKKTE